MTNPTIETLQQLCQTARYAFNTRALIIAGGAPRDVLSGVPIKDIDVFVAIDPDDAGLDTHFARSCRALAEWLGAAPGFRAPQEEYPDVFDLCDIAGSAGVVQVVGLRNVEDPIDDVPTYDFGLSQVFVTPTGLFSTAAAQEDRAHRAITYMGARDDAAFKRSVARYQRLRAKYPPQWQFLNCELLEAALGSELT